MTVDSDRGHPVDNRGHETKTTRSDRGQRPWTPVAGLHRGHSRGGLYPPGVPGGGLDDVSVDRLLDLLQVAIEDTGVSISAPALVRLRARFVELAQLEGFVVVRQERGVLNLDDLDRRADSQRDPEP